MWLCPTCAQCTEHRVWSRVANDLNCGVTGVEAGAPWHPRPACRRWPVCRIGPMPQTRAGRSAILAPGANYGADGPLLMYARLAVHRRGGRTHPIVWELSESSGLSQQRAGVAAQGKGAVDESTAATGNAPVVIGESLGSLAAPVGGDRRLAAGWVTPV